MNDFHDYGDGTRARRWIGMVFRPLLRFSVKALLWLCPDTPIVANVYIGYGGSAIHLKPNAKEGQIINVRIDCAPDTRPLIVSYPPDARARSVADVLQELWEKKQ